MATWHDLPTELVLHILQHFRLTRDLILISRVSHRFRILVEPILYRSVGLRADTSTLEPYGMFHGEDLTRRFRQFARTIVGRPKLGTYVKELMLNSVWDIVDDYDAVKDCRDCNTAVDMDNEAEVATALTAATVPLIEGRMGPEAMSEVQNDLTIIARSAELKGLRNGLVFKGGCRGVAIILLHHCPNLKNLSMLGSASLETIALSCLDLINGGIPAGLRSIEHLQMAYESDWSWTTECIIPFMSLPKLKKFYLADFGGADRGQGTVTKHPLVRVGRTDALDDEGGAALREPLLDASGQVRTQPFNTPYGFIMPPRCSSITKLKIHRSAVAPTLLARLIALPLRLKVLEYEYSVFTEGIELQTFYPGSLLPGLRSQASTLRRLNIYINRNHSFADLTGFSERPLQDRMFGSLAFLEVLETLCVPLVFMISPRSGVNLPDPDPSSGGSELRGIAVSSSATRNILGVLLPPSIRTLHLSAPDDLIVLRALDLPHTLPHLRLALPRLERLYGSRYQNLLEEGIDEEKVMVQIASASLWSRHSWRLSS